MELKRDDVVAVITDKSNLLCKNCASEQDWAAVGDKSKLFMAEKLKDTDSLFFCDKCESRLKA